MQYYLHKRIHVSFEGEATLSMGKAEDFVKKAASGIISAMPFGCMPGTIVSALLKGLKQDSGIPSLSVAYDGVEAACSDIQLEPSCTMLMDIKEILATGEYGLKKNEIRNSKLEIKNPKQIFS